MITPIWEGLILGLTLAFLFGFGPALFALIQTSIHRGLWSGFQMAFGIFLSDVTLVTLCLLGALQIINETPENQLVFGVITGIILIIFGIVTFRRKVQIADDSNGEELNTPSPLTYVLKGFFLNFTNPFVWLFWILWVTAFTSNYKGETHSVIILFSTTLLVILATDMLKCFGAYKIKKYVTPRFIQWINWIAGAGLSVFGIFLLIRAVIEFY
ncbi:MAG: LysE family translocator [Bacteroidales bacterium]|nr:LysE family translocator [Bacteroidales bacterium]